MLLNSPVEVGDNGCDIVCQNYAVTIRYYVNCTFLLHVVPEKDISMIFIRFPLTLVKSKRSIRQLRAKVSL